MADFQYMRFWVGDFLADTQHLDCLETGAYLLLLFAAWRSPDCALPGDDEQLANMARVSPKVWKRIRANVMAFWLSTENGGYQQKRLLKVRRLAEQQYLAAVRAGQASALKRLQTGSTDVQRPFNGRTNGKATNQNLDYESSLSESLTVAARDPSPVRKATGRAPTAAEKLLADLAEKHRRKLMAGK